jgi:hypothetical protein
MILHNDERPYLYRSLSTVQVVPSRRLLRAGYVFYNKYISRISVGKPLGEEATWKTEIMGK